MAKLKLKNIDNLSLELRDKFNGIANTNMKIGIVISLDGNAGASYGLKLAKIVEKEVLKLGCETEIISLPSINERFRYYAPDNYVLGAYRNQVANILELTLSEKNLDGVVFIPTGLNTTLGFLAGSIRLNLPTLVLPHGLTHITDGKSLKEVLSCPGEIATNAKSIFDLEAYQASFAEKIGSGNTFTSENIFNIVLEGMELCTKDAAASYAGSYQKENQAVLTGQTIVNLAKNRLPLKRMINRKSVSNAFMLNFCLGGSPVILDAIMYLAKEAELELDLNKVLGTIKNAPVLFDTNAGVEAYIENGGTWGLIKAMIKNKIIDGNYKTFSDTTLADETKKVTVFENFVTPIKRESLYVLRGNVAERYSFVRANVVPEEKTKVLSNVQVFSSDQEACNAVINKAVTDNSVIVIKDCGKNTETGVSTICQTALAIESMGLTNNHVILTDGFVVDDTKTICISCVYPDSKSGNIKYLKDGDEIEIDFTKGRVNVEVNAREMMLRQKKYVNEHRILPKYLEK